MSVAPGDQKTDLIQKKIAPSSVQSLTHIAMIKTGGILVNVVSSSEKVGVDTLMEKN